MLGSSAAYSHKIYQKLSLPRIAHLHYFANGQIILQTALKFTGYAAGFLLCNLYSNDASLRDNLSSIRFIPVDHNTFRERDRVVRKSSETDSIKFKISSKTSRGKKDSTKDTIIDITSDSQVNSNFPNRWSQASLTFNNYFYLFLYLYI